MHTHVSNVVIDEILQNWPAYMPYVVHGHGEKFASPGAYEARMRNTREFGTIVEVLAFSKVFQKHVVIWEAPTFRSNHTGPSPKWMPRLQTCELPFCCHVPHGRELHILLKDNHYLAMVPVSYQEGFLASRLHAGESTGKASHPTESSHASAVGMDTEANIQLAMEESISTMPTARVQPKLTQAKRVKRQQLLLLTDGTEVAKTPNLVTFMKTRDEGPVYGCVCCTRIHFRNRVTPVTLKWKMKIGDCQDWLHEVPCVQGKQHVCKPCKDSLNKGVMPRMAKSQGFRMSDIATCLATLSHLERKMIAMSSPFMSLRKLRPSGNPQLRGSVTLVPNDMVKIVSCLPRSLDATAVVMVNFKRRLRFNRAAWQETVRPAKILEALNHLCKTSLLYLPWASRLLTIEEIRALTSNLLRSANSDNSGLLVLGPDSVAEGSEDEDGGEEDSDADLVQMLLDLDAAALANNVEIPGQDRRAAFAAQGFFFNPAHLLGHTTTNMVNREPIVANSDTVVNVAPGEDRKPTSLFATPNAEEKAFPVLFGGHKRTAPANVHYHEICNWELLNVDRRFAYDPENLMYKVCCMQSQTLAGVSAMQLRKTVQGYPKITKANAMDKDFMKNMIRNENAFADLKALRSSPAYMMRAKQDVFAMLAQLGPPSWFFTLSMADYHWGCLLSGLHFLAKGRFLDASQVEVLTWAEKTDLISNDPIFCARYFKETCTNFVRNVLGKELDIIGGLRDFFMRDETQGRGTMHDHGVGWPVEPAPRYRTDANAVIESYIDRHVTCDPLATTLALLQLQVHSRHRTCGKRGRFPCKHGYPKFPMEHTTILTPLPSEEVSEDVRRNTGRVKAVLLDMTEKLQSKQTTMADMDVTQEVFLEMCGLDHAAYILCVRNLLTHDEVIIRRKPSALLVNVFNPKALALWQANMDLQYILDPYAAVNYVVHYMMKTDSGVSKAMEAVMRTLERCPASQDEMYYRVGNAFLNAHEMSGQEAAYLALGMPFRLSSRATQWIPTGDPANRTAMIKNMKQLRELDDDCEDTLLPGLLDHYSQRPASLDGICLADYAAWYTKDKVVPSSADPLLHEPYQPMPNEDSDVEDVAPDRWERPVYTAAWPLKCKGLRLRTKAKILKLRHYSRELQETEFFREQLVLYMPWRDEETDILAHAMSYKAKWAEHKEAIAVMALRYRPHAIDWAGIEVDVRKNTCAESDGDDDSYAGRLGAQTQDVGLTEVETADELHVMSLDLAVGLAPDTSNLMERRAFTLGSPGTKLVTEESLANYINCLNPEQRCMFDHTCKQARQKRQGEHMFMTGGAGVGKSYATRAIFQAVTRIHLGQAGVDFQKPPVVVMAPTGTAAFNVAGYTIHGALGIPPNRNLAGPFLRLQSEKLARYQSEWENFRLVIIDEISMVGARMLLYIDWRLRQLKGNDEPFGNVNVLAVGDLYQLKPVMDSWVFEMPQIAYSNILQSPWGRFRMHELTQVMRQDNIVFIQRLNRLRVGAHTQEDLDWFNGRCLQNLSDEERAHFTRNTPHMFYGNKAVAAHNRTFIAEEPGMLHTLIAIDTLVQGTSDKGVEARMLELAKATKTNRAGALPYETELKVNAPVELTVNVDVPDGLTNGAKGILKAFEWALHPTRSVAVLWVLFDEARVGLSARALATPSYRRQPSIGLSWTPVTRWGVRFGVGPRRAVDIDRVQFPVVPCAARTIHRNQGSSMHQAIIGLNKLHHASAAGLHYTAVSRLTSPDGIAFTDFNPHGITTSLIVGNHYQDMRTNRRLQLDLGNPMFNDNLCFSIMTLNCRSLHKNITNLRRSLTSKAYNPSFMLITESWQAQHDPQEMYYIDNYHGRMFPSAAACPHASRPARGLVLYYNPLFELLPDNAISHGTDVVDCCATTHMTPAGPLHVIGMYNPPGQTGEVLLACLSSALEGKRDEPTVIIGDFNVDLL